ncbi:hypothetical protein ES705_25313 [subsurface metagenome]
MPLKLAKHHTLADWDFNIGEGSYSLSPTHFVSSPTSLLFRDPAINLITIIVLCRIPGTQCLPQGEVRTWLRAYENFLGLANFRNQAALGTADYWNCYYIYIIGTEIRLYRWVAGAYSLRDTGTGSIFVNQWVHYRVFWYNGKTPGEVEALCVDVYREVAGEWVKEGDTLYDVSNWFKDSEINRAGPFGRCYKTNSLYCDDTEIWGPV